ncbi:tetrathionate reductase family octaheme c-type cytochrome [Rhodoferax sp.]|uniref:tetrathionate reductase family octaheme c-type cytochrome n=1 Tax=Rhodoferax sp. TaxID=50421 RepID=UPI0026286BB1|nr:tetrathionate reductase family octaheme c-type cytochrome [Rhodoferax sp.]MDD5480394.1 tetrathionate reductase family octaheme c-type cytochrome [Rhodoferax sp.]
MHMRKLMMAALTAILLLPLSHAAASAAATPISKTTADHSKFKVLDQDFASGPEVTKACLTCHTEASKQIHQTQHWTWEFKNQQTGQLLGKKHIVNNFCTSVKSNEAACNSCHIGYGWKDDSFDFTSQENVDCLACHDHTGKYKKPSGFAGNPVVKDTEFPAGSGKVIRGINLKEIAQKVGPTQRTTCGACHFNGGGGDGVKHGDLDSSLDAPDKALDVHMDTEGNNFTCATCHKTDGHQVPGSRYAPTAKDKAPAHLRGKADTSNPATCQSCHGQAPHPVARLNEHTAKIACQTCHVPAFARGGQPTKMSWDWSTAGKLDKNGKPMSVKNEDGYDTYMTIKGDFVWKENVIPEYVWFNGTVNYTLQTDKIVKSDKPVQINRFEGSATDGKSMIWPVKIFRGKQVYDPVNQQLVITHLAGNDDTAFWKNFNWDKAVAAGMTTAKLPFSGKLDFIETESAWPITHMVAPKDKALTCTDCHANNGRLEKVDGLYMPGRSRDHMAGLDKVGWSVMALVLLGVLGHGLIRVFVGKRNHT